MSVLGPAPEMLEPDEDHTEAIGDQALVSHTHYCMVCDADWQHEVGDAGCADGGLLACPTHDDRSRLI